MAVARESGGGEIGKLMFNVYKVTPPPPKKKTPQLYIHITLIKVKEKKKKL